MSTVHFIVSTPFLLRGPNADSCFAWKNSLCQLVRSTNWPNSVASVHKRSLPSQTFPPLFKLPPFVEHGHSVPLNAVAVLDSLPIPSLVRACSPTHPSKRRNSSMGVVRGDGLGVKGSSFTSLDTNRVGRRRNLKSALLRLLKGS